MLAGIFVGGVLYAKLGMKRSVLVSLVLMAISNLSFRANLSSPQSMGSAPLYVMLEGDAALTSFSVAHDRQYRIPFIKKAIATAVQAVTSIPAKGSPA